MPFWLVNVDSTFQRTMDVMLVGFKWNSCLVYLNDVIVLVPTLEEHLRRLEAVLHYVQKANLQLKLSKYSFII